MVLSPQWITAACTGRGGSVARPASTSCSFPVSRAFLPWARKSWRRARCRWLAANACWRCLIAQAEDLPIAMSRLFAPASPLRDQIDDGRVFARYTVIDDEANRHSAYASFQRWLASSAETAFGVTSEFSGQTAQTAHNETDSQAQSEEGMPPAPFPAGF